MDPLLPGVVQRFTRLALLAIAGTTLTLAPTAAAVDGVALPNRQGVVVAWRAASSTAVVITDDRRAYAIHSLRRVSPGTRVRVDGIKWGTPSSGIKWSVAPSGIKWGIKWAKNGSYQSRLTALTGKAGVTSLRGTVVRRFGRRGVAVSIPGSTIILPLRGAVWLPSGKRAKAVGELGRFGSKVTITVAFDAKGRPFGRKVVETAPASARPVVPLAGRVIAVDATTRTVTLQVGSSAFPVALTLNIPASTDLARYPVASEVTVVAVQTSPVVPLAAVGLSLNRTFADADAPPPPLPPPSADPGSPANPSSPTNPDAPPAPPPPAAITAIAQMQASWTDARTQGLIPNLGLFTSERNRLQRVAALIDLADKPGAIAELHEFEARLQTTPPGTISIPYRDEILADAVQLRALLV
jgi:hypothetical protein